MTSRPLSRVYVVFDAVEGEPVPDLRVYRNRPDVAGVVECPILNAEGEPPEPDWKALLETAAASEAKWSAELLKMVEELNEKVEELNEKVRGLGGDP